MLAATAKATTSLSSMTWISKGYTDVGVKQEVVPHSLAAVEAGNSWSLSNYIILDKYILVYVLLISVAYLSYYIRIKNVHII